MAYALLLEYFILLHCIKQQKFCLPWCGDENWEKQRKWSI